MDVEEFMKGYRRAQQDYEDDRDDREDDDERYFYGYPRSFNHNYYRDYDYEDNRDDDYLTARLMAE